MAIARGAGTEIIRSAMFEDIDDTAYTKLIIGEQHHIYTVLSIVVYCLAVQTAGNKFHLDLIGFDAKGATTGQYHRMVTPNIGAGNTFVWNDKFSFNGFEPLAGSMSGTLSTAAEQNAIADQASAVSQSLTGIGAQGTDSFEVLITYIDQNNS